MDNYILQQKLQEKYPEGKFGEVTAVRGCKYLYDESKYNQENDWLRIDAGIEDTGWEIMLPHSCDEWVIGSVKDTEEMIKNLQEAIDYCQANP